MKFTATAALLATSNAMKVRNQAAQTCDSGFNRVMKQKDYTLKSDFVK